MQLQHPHCTRRTIDDEEEYADLSSILHRRLSIKQQMEQWFHRWKILTIHGACQ